VTSCGSFRAFLAAVGGALFGDAFDEAKLTPAFCNLLPRKQPHWFLWNPKNRVLLANIHKPGCVRHEALEILCGWLKLYCCA
jgi:hypothetical protein